MGRLFAGTPWDRPPTCSRCVQPESSCTCPPEVPEPVRLDPAAQTARLRLEKRPRGKVATVITGLDPSGSHLTDLASHLKSLCGSGGTVKDGRIELQGDHVASSESALRAMGYQTRV